MPAIAEQVCQPSGLVSSPSTSAIHRLPDDLRQGLRRHFNAREVSYIAHVLSADELRVMSLKDARILARIKRMAPQRLKRFDSYMPVDATQQRAYHAAQVEWLRNEHYLLSARLGRCPTHAELSADFKACQNGQRFRAYYVMKYPERMKFSPACSLKITAV